MWWCWSRCDFIGGDVLLEGGRWSLKSSNLASMSLSFLMPVDPDVKFSTTAPAPWLPACLHASHHDNNGLNFWTVNRLRSNVSLITVTMVVVFLHNNKSLNKTLAFGLLITNVILPTPFLSIFFALFPGLYNNFLFLYSRTKLHWIYHVSLSIYVSLNM